MDGAFGEFPIANDQWPMAIAPPSPSIKHLSTGPMKASRISPAALEAGEGTRRMGSSFVPGGRTRAPEASSAGGLRVGRRPRVNPPTLLTGAARLRGEVMGSSPRRFFNSNGMAQRAAHRIHVPEVAGSSPAPVISTNNSEGVRNG